MEVDTSLEQEVSRNWSEIMKQFYVFDRRHKEVLTSLLLYIGSFLRQKFAVFHNLENLATKLVASSYLKDLPIVGVL